MLMIQNRSIICVMVWVLVQLTAKIDWNMGHFLGKKKHSAAISICFFFSYFAVLVLMHQHLHLVYHYGEPRFKRVHCKFVK